MVAKLIAKKASILTYFHDPMCSWCWGYRPVWQQLKAALPAAIEVQNVLGGLAPDSKEVMPLELQMQIQGYWRHIESTLGTTFNFDFWKNNQPRRATYKACRAVLAAKNQGREEVMIEAIQQAYYLRAMNPSDTAVLVQLATEIGLHSGQFSDDLEAEKTYQQLAQQIDLTCAAPIAGFPSLVLEVAGRQLPVRVDYKDYRLTLAQIKAFSSDTIK